MKKVFRTEKAITGFVIDPDLETADVDTSNNSWPKKETSEFERLLNLMKSKTK